MSHTRGRLWRDGCTELPSEWPLVLRPCFDPAAIGLAQVAVQADDPALVAARIQLGLPGIMFSAVVRADVPSTVALRYWIGIVPRNLHPVLLF